MMNRRLSLLSIVALPLVGLGFASARTATAPAGPPDCCFPGSPCCEAEDTCCLNTVATRVKPAAEANCCTDVEPCCEADEACCDVK